MYGYEIVYNIFKVIDVNEGIIYFILRRFIKDLYFEIYILEFNEGFVRKYYRIILLGKENLFNLMEEWREFVKVVEILISEDEGGNEFE